MIPLLLSCTELKSLEMPFQLTFLSASWPLIFVGRNSVLLEHNKTNEMNCAHSEDWSEGANSLGSQPVLSGPSMSV